jgi:hypothetical protein
LDGDVVGIDLRIDGVEAGVQLTGAQAEAGADSKQRRLEPIS